ncbi:MAG: hypothetical protein P8O89_02325 [Polaribacter sp.]|nr:hypothetical protein [Polaribacter sp.]
MKKIIFCTFFISLILFSCDRKEVNIPIYSYSLLQDEVLNFQQNISKKDEIISFDYVNMNDSINRLHFNYNKVTDVLISNKDTFYSTKREYNSKEIKFRFYQTKDVKSNNRSLVFNEKYGLLSNLAFGSDYLFTTESISKIEKEILFKELFLQLNEVNIK